MKRTLHTPEQIIRKLKTADQLIAQGKTVCDERELMTRLTSVHVENSEQGLGSNRPVHVHFTAKNC
jgi:hypothetical protein